MENLRKKIAQLLCIGFDGYQLSDATQLKKWLMHPDGLGALILFDYNYKKERFEKNILSFSQLKQLNNEIKSFYKEHHPESLGIWLSIDVEGGKVDRLAKVTSYEHLPSAKEIAFLKEHDRYELWMQHAKTLQSLNIDLNFAPVVDLDLSPNKGIFGPLQRCFSADPTIVAKLSSEYIQILNQHGILACLKHFPGHGSATGDSHLDFVDVSNTFSLNELNPYQILQQQTGLIYSIMTAHVINRQLDSSCVPATLSKSILSDLLRNEFSFPGIIISDDLQMKAISKYYTRKEALLKTLLAGSDMIIFGNQLGWDEPNQIVDDIEDLINNNYLSEHVINQAYERVIKYKLLLEKSIA